MKKFLKIVGILLVVLFGAMIAIPLLFKSQVVSMIEEEVNANVNAEVDLGEISLSLFSDFPNLTLEINDFSITGVETFEGVPLAQAGQLLFEIDLASLLTGSQVKIVDVQLNSARFEARVLESGEANYDIFPTTEESPADSEKSSGDFNLALNHYRIGDLEVVFVDESQDIHFAMSGFTHEGSGNFSAAETEIHTTTEIASMSAATEGIHWISKASLSSVLDGHWDGNTQVLTLGENNISFNQLRLHFTGGVGMLEEGFTLELEASSPSTDFADVLSVVPALFTKDFEGIKTSGSFDVKAKVNGKYTEQDMPAFDVAVKLENGSFQYPELPAGVSAINGNIVVAHPGGDLDRLTLDINSFSLKIDQQPLAFDMHLKHPMTDPYVAIDADANLELGTLGNSLPMDSVELMGNIDLSVHASGRQSDFEAQNLESIKLEGTVVAKEVEIGGDMVPMPVVIASGTLKMTPQKASLSKLKMNVGSSDFSGYGQLDNMAAFALGAETLEGRFVFSSDVVNLNEWMTEEEAPATEASAATDSSALEVIPVPENLDLELLADIKKLDFELFPAEDIAAKLVVANGRVTIDNGRMKAMGGQMKANGFYDAVEGQEAFVAFDLDMKGMNFEQVINGFESFKTFAPALEAATGKFNGGFSFEGPLQSDMMPNTEKLDAKGYFSTKGIGFTHETLEKIGELVQNPKYSKIRLQDALITFIIKDGRMEVEPFELKLGGYKGTFEGSSGLDKTLDFAWSGDVPVKDIAMGQPIPDFLQTSANIPLVITIKGTADSPKVGVDFASALQSTGDVVKEIISNEIKKAEEQLVEEINKGAQDLVAEAEKIGDQLIADAQVKADQIKKDARKEGDKILADAKREIKKLQDEAKGNFFAEQAAKVAAEELEKEAKKQVDALIAKTDKEADKLVEAARAEKVKLVEEAKKNAKI